MITLDVLGAGGGIRHAFFTRRGGVSQGPFDALNCGFGSGDDDARVVRNRALAMEQLGLPPDRLVTCRQVHSARAVAVQLPWRREEAPRVDGLVTRIPGIALGVLAADCAPILLHDPAARVIGAAHGGWRGALGGIVEASIAAMERLGAVRTRIRAGIGPCIGRFSYEVGPEFPAPIIAEDAAATAYFAAARRSGHFMFDLAGYIAHRLMRSGVEQVECVDRDTVPDEADFFSYRRSRLRGEAGYGRGLSAIVLEA